MENIRDILERSRQTLDELVGIGDALSGSEEGATCHRLILRCEAYFSSLLRSIAPAATVGLRQPLEELHEALGEVHSFVQNFRRMAAFGFLGKEEFQTGHCEELLCWNTRLCELATRLGTLSRVPWEAMQEEDIADLKAVSQSAEQAFLERAEHTINDDLAVQLQWLQDATEANCARVRTYYADRQREEKEKERQRQRERERERALLRQRQRERETPHVAHTQPERERASSPSLRSVMRERGSRSQTPTQRTQTSFRAEREREPLSGTEREPEKDLLLCGHGDAVNVLLSLPPLEIATGSADGIIRVFSLTNNSQNIPSPDSPLSHTNTFTTNTETETDTENVYPVRELRGHSAPVLSLCLSTLTQSALTQRSRSVSFSQRRPTSPSSLSAAAQTGSSHSARSQRLVSGDAAGEMRVWDLATGRCVGCVQALSGPVHFVLRLPSGRLCVSGGDKESCVQVWKATAVSERVVREKERERARSPSLSLSLSRTHSHSLLHSQSQTQTQTQTQTRSLSVSRSHTLSRSLSFSAESASSQSHSLNTARSRNTAPSRPVSPSLSRSLSHSQSVSSHVTQTANTHGLQNNVSLARETTFSLSLKEGDRVFCVTSFTDPSLLGCACEDGTVRVINTRTRRTLRVLRGHAAAVLSLSLICGGDANNALSQPSCGGANESTCSSSASAVLSLSQTHGQSLSADAQLLLSSSKDCTVRLWDVTHSQCLRVFAQHTRSVRRVLSLSRSLFLSVSLDGAMRLWRLRDGACEGAFIGHARALSDCLSLSDGSLVSAATQPLATHAHAHAQCTARVWRNTRIIAQSSLSLSVLTGKVYAIAGLSPAAPKSGEGEQPAEELRNGESGSSKRLNLRQLIKASGIKDLRIKGAANKPKEVERCVATTGDDRCVRVWDLSAKRERCAFYGHEGTVFALAEAHMLLSHSTISSHNTPSQSPSATRTRSQSTSRTPPRTPLDSPTQRLTQQCSRSLSPMTPLRTPSPSQRAHTTTSVESVLISGSADRTLRLWLWRKADARANTQRCARVLSGHRGAVSALCVLRDATRDCDVALVSGANDCELRVWGCCVSVPSEYSETDSERFLYDAREEEREWMSLSLHTVDCVHVLRGHNAPVLAVTALRKIDSTEERCNMASSARDGQVRLWDAFRGRCVAVLSTSMPLSAMPSLWGSHSLSYSRSRSESEADAISLTHNETAHVFSLTALSHNRLCGASSDGALRVWDTHTCELKSCVKAHTGYISAVMCVSNDSSLSSVSDAQAHLPREKERERVVSAGEDGFLRVWEFEGREPTPVWREIWDEHRATVLSLSQLPGGLVCSGGADGAMKTWGTL